MAAITKCTTVPNQGSPIGNVAHTAHLSGVEYTACQDLTTALPSLSPPTPPHMHLDEECGAAEMQH